MAGRRLCRPQQTPPDLPSGQACEGAGQPRGPVSSLQGAGQVLGGQCGDPGMPKAPGEGCMWSSPGPALRGGGLGVFEELRVLHSLSGVPRSALWSREGAGQGAPSQAHGGTPGSQPEGTERLGSLVRGLCGQPGCRARGAGPPAQAVPWESQVSPGLRFLSWPWGGGGGVCAPRGCACLGLGRGLAAAVTPGPNARPRLGAGGRQRQDRTDGRCVCFPPRQPYFWAAPVLGAVSGQSGWGLWQSGQLCWAEGPPGGCSLGWGGCLVPFVAHGALGAASPPPVPPLPLTSRAQPPAQSPSLPAKGRQTPLFQGPTQGGQHSWAAWRTRRTRAFRDSSRERSPQPQEPAQPQQHSHRVSVPQPTPTRW